MISLNNYIIEKLKISKNLKTEYTLFPETQDELKKMIKKEMEVNGNECSLNHIDVSKITDMLFLFSRNAIIELHEFNGDISEWNVSNVENMRCMFLHSKFNGDIYNWDVSNVTDMALMFRNSEFNGDISGWDVSNVKDMNSMFRASEFNGNISNWDVSNVTNMYAMFEYSKFNQDISKWKINPNCTVYDIFTGCDINSEFKPKLPKK